MKKSNLVLAASTLITVAILVSCNTPAQKVENAESNVIEANKDLDKANQDYVKDMESYRKETADKITVNNQSIAEFQVRIEHEKKEAKAEYKKRIDELEQKNTDMKKRMDDYKEEGKENWETFKTEFSHDMNELGQAFKDFTIKNTK